MGAGANNGGGGQTQRKKVELMAPSSTNALHALQEEQLVEKCMASWPNKFSLEQIKKQSAYAWAFGQNSKGELSLGNFSDASLPERVRGIPANKRIIFVSSGAKHTAALTDDG